MAGPRWLVVILLSSACLGAPIDELLSRRRFKDHLQFTDAYEASHMVEGHQHGVGGHTVDAARKVAHPFASETVNSEEIATEKSVIPLSAESVTNMLNELIEAPEDIKQELVEQTSKEITKQLKMTRKAGMEELEGSEEEEDSESEESSHPDLNQSVLHIIELRDMNKEEESEEDDDGRVVRRIRIRKLKPDLSQRASKAYGSRKRGTSKQLGSFRYAVKNKKSEQVFGHQAMYGEANQSGSYFVQFADGRILYVTYTADHRGYRPLLRYFDSREELNAFLRPHSQGGQIFPPRTTTAAPVRTTANAVLLTTESPDGVLPAEHSSEVPVEQPLITDDLDAESSLDVSSEVVPSTASPVDEAPLNDTLTTLQDEDALSSDLTTVVPTGLSADFSSTTYVDTLTTILPDTVTLVPELDQFNNDTLDTSVSSGGYSDVDNEEALVTTVPELLDEEVDVTSTPEEETVVTTTAEEDGILITKMPEEDTLVTVNPEEGVEDDDFTLNESEEVNLVTSKPEEDSLITKQPETLVSSVDDSTEGSLTTSIFEEEIFTTSEPEDILVTTELVEESLVTSETTEKPFIASEINTEVLVTSKIEEDMESGESDEEYFITDKPEEEVMVTNAPEEGFLVTNVPEEDLLTNTFVTSNPDESLVTSDYGEEFFVTGVPEEHFGNSEPEKELPASIKLEEDLSTTSKPVEELYITNDPEGEFPVTAEPDEEFLNNSKFEEDSLVTSNPKEETLVTNATDDMMVTIEPEEEFLTTVTPEEPFITSDPEGHSATSVTAAETFATDTPDREPETTDRPDTESEITNQHNEESVTLNSVNEQLFTTVLPTDDGSEDNTERPDSLSEIDTEKVVEDSPIIQDDSMLEVDSSGLLEETLHDNSTTIPEDAEYILNANDTHTPNTVEMEEAQPPMSMSDVEDITLQPALQTDGPPVKEEESPSSANDANDKQEGNVINILPPPSLSEKALYMEMLPKNLDMSIVPSSEQVHNETQVPSNTSNANAIPIIPHGNTRPEYVAISVLQKDTGVAQLPADAKEKPSNQHDAGDLTSLPREGTSTHHQQTRGPTTQSLVRKAVNRARNLSSRRTSLLFGKRRPSALTRKLRPSLKLSGQKKSEDDSASESLGNRFKFPSRMLGAERRVPTTRNARLYQHWLKRQSRTLGALKNRRLFKN
ncbi:uncharacterized protein LOC125026481 [Penaeus chinensis]|uniref:uncharacterized protein LOC125026481 n=1 Tax=Penaeus chinensis TaxID=139456 RepID=UPI001FB7B955|nr:uncharacterized protein LOC125026481 [Penaeus chinensis]